jgi:hypothetical protein
MPSTKYLCEDTSKFLFHLMYTSRAEELVWICGQDLDRCDEQEEHLNNMP